MELNQMGVVSDRGGWTMKTVVVLERKPLIQTFLYALSPNRVPHRNAVTLLRTHPSFIVDF